jgi:hypothetical protein
MAATPEWQKSSFSDGGDAPNCVEVAAFSDTLLLREGEAPVDVLTLTPGALAGLIRQVKAG